MVDMGPRAQRRLTSPSRTLSPSAANNGAARRSSRGERRRRVGVLVLERVVDMPLHLCNCVAHSLSIRRKAAERRETLGHVESRMAAGELAATLVADRAVRTCTGREALTGWRAVPHDST